MTQTNKKIGVPLEGFAELARKVAAEGAVLLENQGNVLPVQKGETVSIFGRCQIDYYRSGTGSGGAVNVAYTTNLLGSMRLAQGISVNETLAATYEAWHKEHPFDNGGGGWAAEPWHQAEMPLTDELVDAASRQSDKALIVIGRTAGEDQDNAAESGSYLLTPEEKEMIAQVTRYFSKTAVILNVPNIIDMSFVHDASYVHPIGAVLYAWQGGQEGGNGIADVITGVVTPGGKLTDTIAASIEDYPSTKNYGGEDQNLYQEDIYVGYRYFETFAPDKVLYEFGYGMSYTTFSIDGLCAALSSDETITVTATVTNTGDTYSGKEVVQVYYEAPQGKLGKPVRQLAGFAKTSLLAPKESETVTITSPLSTMASYDDSGVTGHPYCYVLEDGEYRLFAGSSVRKTTLVPFVEDSAVTLKDSAAAISFNGTSIHVAEDSIFLGATTVVEELEQALAPTENFKRLRPGAKRSDGSYEPASEEVPRMQYSLRERIESRLPKALPITGNKCITLHDAADGKATLDDFIAQLNEEELATIVRGEGMCSTKVTPGTASCFGGVGDSLFSYGIPLACCADGPSGIRMEGGLKATQLPIGTLQAATWNPALIEELYVMEGKELLRNEIDSLLGPGLNIRRNPLNGRNFEYFSEDPFVTGTFTSATVRGIHKGGATATMKHFAGNNQESNRSVVNSVISERALREIYLKGFEMGVKEGGARSIMTSYNPLNGHWCASNYDLCTTILRKEWGFDGIVMTDWWAKMNSCVDGGDADRTSTNFMVRAGNDLYMVVNNDGAELNASNDNTLPSLANGTLTIGELQRCARHICSFLMQAPVFGRKQTFDEFSVTIAPTDKEPEKVDFLLKNAAPTDAVLSLLASDSSRQTAALQKNVFLPSFTDSVWLEVKEGGDFLLVANTMSQEDVLAQSTVTILLNDSNLCTINTNGTLGQWMTHKLGRVHLDAGFYKLHTNVVKSGMQIGYLALKPIAKKARV
ncbi:glycoside hydrolase family 3 protein [Roseburia sp. 831b]|uniref:glycoside hydrolase family 3 protein n=1 Tax=Roseburia sp. 831b TaxID=1261635 RepID=UPI0009533FD1|nr:glycoside hydrolase family 3 protein [Roseburia sp. 831b]WVK73110.1 glycoside hydrolase family 3 N-terminal domain-containing protein [Roseburia sp. 831b]